MEGQDGFPEAGETARSLGARRDFDIQIDAAGLVRPGLGGMSVGSGTYENLPRHRIPRELGGTGKDPMWYIGEDDLGPDLSFRPDPRHAGHGFVEPARIMQFEEYQYAIHATRRHWHCLQQVSNDAQDSDQG